MYTQFTRPFPFPEVGLACEITHTHTLALGGGGERREEEGEEGEEGGGGRRRERREEEEGIRKEERSNCKTYTFPIHTHTLALFYN